MLVSKVEAPDGNGQDGGNSAGDAPRLQTDSISRHSKSRIDTVYILWSAGLAGCLRGAWDRKRQLASGPDYLRPVCRLATP